MAASFGKSADIATHRGGTDKKREKMQKFIGALVALSFVLLISAPASADTNCEFVYEGADMVLQGNCWTDETIFVPDGSTLVGGGYRITAVDPNGDHFRGAIVANAGSWAGVLDLILRTEGLTNACDGGADRLRGVMFEEASGIIRRVTIESLNQGASGCQEGNAVEVRAAPFDNTATGTYAVDISHCNISGWQKTGIVCNGDVDCLIEHNTVNESATQENLAANSIQIGFGARGIVQNNWVEGNQWMGTSNYAATAMLVYLAAPDTRVRLNQVRGNSDIGVYFYADLGEVWNNVVFDQGLDHPNSSYDIGIGNWGTGNVVDLNKVRGFDDPYDGEVGDRNIEIPSPAN